MSSTREVTVSFDNVSVAEANRLASELRQALLDASPDIKVEQRRGDEHAQDFGATLVLVFGTPAIIALSRGVADWLRKRTTASLTIKTREGAVVASGLSSRDARSIIESKLGSPVRADEQRVDTAPAP